MLRNGYPTLVSLNSSAKITDEMLRIWAQILHARDDARLIIMVKEDSAESALAHMQPRVEAAGMPLERVSVLHQQPLCNFMEMGYIADIALDTSPISGGTTTLHTLWMGIPVVTLDAQRGVEASTARILRGILAPCGEIAENEQGYVNAVLDLMDSPQRIKQLRMEVRDRLQKSVLMDYPARTADLEKAARLMWLNYLCGATRNSSITADLKISLADADSRA